MTLPNLFIDNTTLNNIFGRGANYNASSGINILNQLAQQYNIVVTDVIASEANVNPNYGGDSGTFAAWMSDNGITPVATGVSTTTTDAGEISMVTAAQSSSFSGQTNYIASDDTSYFPPLANNGSDITDVSKIFQIQDLGNQLQDNGQLSVDQYIELASSNATMNKGNPGVTQWRTPEAAETASPLTYDPATNSVVNGNPGGTNITASQAAGAEPAGEAGTASSLSQIGAAIQEIAATNPTLATVLGGTVNGLVSTGIALIAYDILSSGATAVSQANSGNFSDATLTIENVAARVELGLGGAEAGAAIGAEWGTFFGPVGTVVGGILGGIGGSILGVTDASTVVNAINTGVQSAISHIAAAVSNIDPSFSTTLGGSNLNSILTPNGSGQYQLPSGSVINETGQFAASVDGSTLGVDSQGNTNASVPTTAGTQVLVNTSGSSNLDPGAVTPGTDEYTGSTVDFTVNGNEETATVLYRNTDGDYVIDGSSVQAVGGGPIVTFPRPTVLDDGVTINSITPPSTPTTTKVTTENESYDFTTGVETDTTDGMASGSIAYTQTTNTASNGAVTANINGSGDSASLDNATINIAADAAATVAGDANTMAVAAGAAVALAAGSSGNTVSVTGNSSTVTDGGSGNYVNLLGNNETDTASGSDDGATIQGTSDTATFTGAGDLSTVNGGSDSVSFSGNSSIAQLNGAGDSVMMLTTAGSGTLYLDGSDQTATAEGADDNVDFQSGGTGGTANVYGSGDVVTVTGNDNYIGLDSADESGTFSGTDDGATLQGTSDTATFTGGGDLSTVNGGSDSVSFSGNSSIAQLNGTGDSVMMLTTVGSGTIYLDGSDQTATAEGADDNVDIQSGGTGGSANVYGSGDVVTVTGNNNYVGLDSANESGTFSGSDDGATIQGTSDTATFTGAGDLSTVNGGSDSVSFSGNSSIAQLNGAGDSVMMLTTAGSGTLYLDGSDQTATAEGADDNVDFQSGGTGGTANVYGSGDVVTVTGNDNYIGLDSADESGTFSGTDDGATLQGTSDTATFTGASAGSTVNGSGDNVTFGGNNAIGALNGTGDSATFNGTSADAYLAGSSESATLNGSSGYEAISGTGGTAALNGSSDEVDVTGTSSGISASGSHDVIVASNTTIDLNGSSVVETVDGSNDVIDSNSAISIYVNGNDNTTNGSNDIITADGTGDITYGSDDEDYGDEGYGGDGYGDGDGDGDGDDARRGGSFGRNTISTSNGVVTLDDGETAIVTGSGNTINVGNDDTLTMDDSAPNTVILNGNDSTVTDSGTGDSYTLYGQDNTLDVSNATITVEGGATATIGGGSYLNTIGLFGIDSTLADEGAFDAITVGGSSNTVDLSGSGNLATFLGASVTFSGSNEQIAVEGGNTVTIESGTEATVIGVDGTLTANNNTSSPQNIIDWNAGGSEVETFTNNSDGSLTEDDQGFSSSDGTGTSLYQQVTTTETDGAINSTISGQGDVSGLSNATITLSDDALATLTGGSNVVNIGNDTTLSLTGVSTDTVTVSGNNSGVTDDSASYENSYTLSGNNDSLTLSSTGDTVTIGASSNGADVLDQVGGNGTAAINGTNALLEFSGPSSESVTFGSGATGTLKLDFAPGFSGTVAGMADGDGIDLGDFLFSSTPSISGVTGTGAAGTATNVTIADGSQQVTLALLNQYANQFGVSASAYTLSADSTAGSAGTLLQLAAAH